MNENRDTLEDSFTEQCWYIWNEGFRYSYMEYKDVDKAIEEACKVTEAFKKQFKE